MYININRKSNSKTKTKISLALYEILRRKPYASISVKEICDRAHVSRMTFYRYYKDKDEVFLDYSDEIFERLFDTITKRDNPSIFDIVVVLFEYFKQNQKQIEKLREANMSYILQNQFSSYLHYIVKNIKSERLSFNAHNPTLVPFLSGGMYNVVMDWSARGMKEEPEEMAKYVIDIFSGK